MHVGAELRMAIEAQAGQQAATTPRACPLMNATTETLVLSVKMLGGLAFYHDGRRTGAALGSSGRLLAAYLVEFPGRIHRRERLAELFWRDLDPDRSRAALNTALWRVRKLLADERAGEADSPLFTSGSEVVFESAERLSVDTHRFDGSAQTALVANSTVARANSQALEDAAAGYAGSFLEGDDSVWVIAERERLHSLYVRCLNEMIRVYFTEGRYENAITAARRILAVDPFRESVQRSVALLLVLNGQRAQAIQELRRWSDDIKREVGVGPMPETAKLENAIITGRIFDQLPELTKAYFVPMSQA
jgi:DNA-binding SARP family transcriptional activator